MYYVRKYFNFFGSNQRDMYFTVFLTCKMYIISHLLNLLFCKLD